MILLKRVGFHHQILYFTVAKLMEVRVLKMALITRESPLDRGGIKFRLLITLAGRRSFETSMHRTTAKPLGRHPTQTAWVRLDVRYVPTGEIARSV